jgi:type IV pilus assembly protein PilE
VHATIRKTPGQRGFTLIELLIAVTIIGIIAAVAYPAYTLQVQKSGRAEAKARLVQAAQLLERFYSDNNSYLVDVSGGNLVVNTGGATVAGFAKLMNVSSGTTVYSGSNNESTSKYTITLSSAAQNSFTLTATPRLNQVADTKCANLTLTNTGVKGISGTTTDITNCW